MAEMNIHAQQKNVGRGQDGQIVGLRGLRDGTLYNLPWYMALVLEGRVFQAQAGKPDALLTIMTTYADTSKTIFVDTADGTAMIPFAMEFTFGAAGAANDYFKFFTSPTVNGIGGTETAITPINLLMGTTTPATASIAYHTASSETDTVTGLEVTMLQLYVGQDIDAVAIRPDSRWSVARDGFAPVGLDGCSLNLACYCATSGTGCGSLTWAELPESAIT